LRRQKPCTQGTQVAHPGVPLSVAEESVGPGLRKEIRAASRKARKGRKEEPGLGFMLRDKSLAHRVHRVLMVDRRVHRVRTSFLGLCGETRAFFTTAQPL